MTTDTTTSSEVQTENVGVSAVTQCSVEECVKWKACWRDVERSHRCACDEATCNLGPNTSAYAVKGTERRTKGELEMSLQSSVVCCLASDFGTLLWKIISFCQISPVRCVTDS